MFRLTISPMIPAAGRALRPSPSSLVVLTSSSSLPSSTFGARHFQTNPSGVQSLLNGAKHSQTTTPMSHTLRSWYRTSGPLSDNKAPEPKGILEDKPQTEGAAPEKETQSLISKDETIPTGAAIATAVAVAPILLGAAGILYYPPINFHLAQHITSLQLTYGTMFISFFGASHFGFAASNYQAPPPDLTIPDASSSSSSSSSTLRGLQYALGLAAPMATWGCLFLSPLFSYTSLLGATTGLFLGDLFFWKKGMVPVWWVKMRYRATIAVLVGLGASFMVVQK